VLDGGPLSEPYMTMNARKLAPILLALLLAFGAGVFFTTAGSSLFGWTHLTRTGLAEGDTQLASNPETLEEAFVTVAERVNPTVVMIDATSEPQAQNSRNQQRQRGPNPFQGTPFEQYFDQFEGQVPGQETPREGIGSGVVVRQDGYILTNNHVVENFDTFRIRFFDGSEARATLVGRDPASDLAIIKVDKTGLPTVSLGQDNMLKVGQWVMAFGSPLSPDLSNTVTTGIVSALGRYSSEGGGDQPRLGDYIQTDAAVNPGNSGGPLINLRGELVGLNNAIYTRTGGFQGISFAIPVDVIRNVMNQLLENGTVRRAMLGVTIGPVSANLAAADNIPRGAAQVGSVNDGSAGERAGIRPGDVILSVDGRALRDYRELTQRILNKRPGDTVTLEVLRDGSRRTLSARLDERDMGGARAEAASSGKDGGTATEKPSAADQPGAFEEGLGFAYRNVAALSAQQREEMGLPASVRTGVIVTDLSATSSAFRDAGLTPGSLITSVNGQAVGNVADFERIYRALPAGQSFRVQVANYRDGQVFQTRTALTKPR